MPKKCLPGIICIENLTLGVLLVIVSIVCYIVYAQTSRPVVNREIQHVTMTPGHLGGIPAKNDVFNDPYAPPLKEDGFYFRSDSGDIRGHPPIQVPVNIETRGLSTQYSQMGILTSPNSNDKLILPLMGRRHMSGRDKWQYYTISNTGTFNTKLPIVVNGKSGTSEYGCDQIQDGDNVYVEGYKDVFNVTVYENNTFSYIPF